MPNLQISNLDFDSIKQNFKNYLQSQPTFQDYNFDGSSLSIFLDILAYNTFYNAFYTNTIANEMFLDSASDRAAVVSRAKALGYIPSSAISSSAFINIEAHVLKVDGEVTPTTSSIISLNSGIQFTTAIQGSDYNFITTAPVTLYFKEDSGQDYWIYYASNVKITEGTQMTYSWTVQNVNDKYQIPNSGIDINSLVVNIKPSISSTSNTVFYRAKNITTISTSDPVYWIFEGSDQKYYLEFGNGILGQALAIGNVISISYLITGGAEANGARSFGVGNYSYANNLIQEVDTLTVTNANYTNLHLTTPTAEFEKDSLVRGMTSNTTAYVYNYDSNTTILSVYGATNSFTFLESVREETFMGANTVYGANAIITSISTQTSTSGGGADIESSDSIKFYAPKSFSAQNRLVTSTDYEGIIMNEYPYLEDVVAWGGEEMDPQQLGSVFISAKPIAKSTLESWEKTYILNTIIEPKKMIGMNVSVIDPDYIYIQPIVNIKYTSDIDAATTQESIITDVTNEIINFGNTKLNSFKNSFYYSQFCATVDTANPYVLSNVTDVVLLKNFQPTLNIPYTDLNTKTLKFSNAIWPYSSNSGIPYILTSTEFSANVSSTTLSGLSFGISPFNNKTLVVANSSSTVISNAGTIDYTNGIVEISNVNITTTSSTDWNNNSIIQVFVNPESNDLVCSKQQILSIYPTFTVSATAIRKQQ